MEFFRIMCHEVQSAKNTSGGFVAVFFYVVVLSAWMLIAMFLMWLGGVAWLFR